MSRRQSAYVPTEYQRRKPGRPAWVDTPMREVFLDAIRHGNKIGVAAKAAGCTGSQISEWLARGRGRDSAPQQPRYIRFVEDYEKAMAEAHMTAVGSVWRGMRKDPRFATWWLERNDPEWRLGLNDDAAAAAAARPINQNVIVIDRETLERIGLARLTEGSGGSTADLGVLVEDVPPGAVTLDDPDFPDAQG